MQDRALARINKYEGKVSNREQYQISQEGSISVGTPKNPISCVDFKFRTFLDHHKKNLTEVMHKHLKKMSQEVGVILDKKNL